MSVTVEFGPIPTFYTDLRPCILQSSSATACLISRANSEFSCLYSPNSITSICCGFVELLCLRTRNNPHSRLAVAARVNYVINVLATRDARIPFFNIHILSVSVVLLCDCLCSSVCHKSVFYWNGWTNRAGFWHVSFLPPVLHSFADLGWIF